MDVTLSLDASLVEKAREIAADRGVTLAELIGQHLESVVAENALTRSFQMFRCKIGKRNWTREDLHDRS
jgi:hypothetical protein